MAVAPTIFNVLASMKFEVGAALAGGNLLGSKLKTISNQVEGVNNQFKALAVTVATEFTGGSLGIVGVLQKAVHETNQFTEASRRLANQLHLNPKRFAEGPLSYADSLQIAKGVYKDIAFEADKLGLNANLYAQKFESFKASLFPKGLAGSNFSNVRRLTSATMLAEEMLPGLDRVNVGQAATNILEGGAHNQSILWRKLTQDTQTLSGFAGIGGAGRFNRLQPKVRMEKLIKAFEETFKSADALAARINTLDSQFTRLNNRFSGFTSILIPLGQAINPFLIRNLKIVIDLIDNQLKPVLGRVGHTLGEFLGGKNLSNIQTSIDKFTSISVSMEKSKFWAIFSYIAIELSSFLFRMKKIRSLIGTGILKSLRFFGLATVGAAGVALRGWRLVGRVFLFVVRGLYVYTKFYTAMLFIQRIFRKAKAIADESNRSYVANNFNEASSVFEAMGKALARIVAPFKALTDWLAKLIAPLFTVEFRIGLLAKLLTGFSEEVGTFKEAADIVKSKVTEMSERFLDLAAALSVAFIKMGPLVGAFGGTIAGGRLGKKFGPLGALIGSGLGGAAGLFLGNKILKPHEFKSVGDLAKEQRKKLEDHTFTDKKDEVVKNQIINNIAKLEIRNQFPENLEPDRVAVAIKNIFEEAAENPVGSGFRNSALIPGV